VTSADLVKVELEIMGDTYWLVDSGFSNYFAKESAKSPLMTEDGTANYEGQDVYIFITFRTPADVNQRTGNFEFNKDKVSPFTGIYRVVKCLTRFAEGQFRQTLTCVRLQAQPSDFADKIKTDKTNNTTTKVGGETKPATNTSETTEYDFDDDFYI